MLVIVIIILLVIAALVAENCGKFDYEYD